jgi:D-cysteine desulfhydrase
VAEPPLLRRFPELARIPRVSLGTFPTAIDRVVLRDRRTLLVKRDDLSGERLGGNKVRGLEWLLGAVSPGDRVLTVGPRGSTHALATATYARELSARVTVVRWNQEMHSAARRVDTRIRAEARVIDASSVIAAYVVAAALRAVGAHWIPAGGASALATLGHVNAGLELAEQIAAGDIEAPERVVVPLGTGGTAAGIALGLKLAGVPSRVVAVRVVPRVIGRLGRVLSLARAATRLIERHCANARVPRLTSGDVVIEQDHYGGGYGRPVDPAPDEVALRDFGIRLDDTYTRKAFAAAVAQSPRALFWLTFDGRLLQD